MTRLPRLEQARELLDEPNHDPEELEESLDDVAAVNRWLGGTRALLRRLPPLLPATRPAHLLDAGTGSGDLPRAIVRWARRHDLAVHITATDLHPQVLAIARRRSAVYPEIEFQRANALALPYDPDSFDVAMLSLTLHHFDGPDAVTALRELGRVARHAILIGELERSRPAYLGARLLAATLWRHNRLTRHDGPISVLRAFTPAELLDLARDAGLRDARVYRHPLFRLVLTARPATHAR